MRGTIPSRSTRRQGHVVASDAFTRADSATTLGSTELGRKLWVPSQGIQGPEFGGYLYLPGLAGITMSAPDSAALSITGNLDIRCLAAFNNWSSVNSALVSKYEATGNQRSYQFYVASSGKPRLIVNTDGTSASDVDSLATASAGLTNGVATWLRATWRASDGRVQFFTAAGTIANPVTSDWTQVGTDLTANIVSIKDSTAALEIGSINSGASKSAAGKFYRTQIRNNILDDGTGIVFDADFSKQPAATLSFTEDSSNAATVSLAGANWGVSSNAAYTPSGRTALAVAVDTRCANGEITCTWGTATDGQAVVARYSDPINMLYWLRVGGSMGLYHYINAVSTASTLAYGTAAIPAAGDVDTIVLNGPTVTILRNRLFLVSYTETFNQNATRHGLMANLANTARFNDWLFKAAA